MSGGRPRAAIVLTVGCLVLALLPGTGAPARAADASAERRAPLDEACWTPTFDEPFDSLSLHDENTGEGRWTPAYIWGADIIINEEQQYYVDPRAYRHDPFEIDNGVLDIVAQPTPDALKPVVKGQQYVSGVLTTEHSFAQRYGRFEVRARVPEGQGLWSAFWLLPSFEQWPEGVDILPEIDVMESLGHDPSVYHTTLHTNQHGQLDSHAEEHRLDASLADDFHTYSVVWDEAEVRWYLDGRWMAAEPTPDDYTRPVHFLLNLAVGGTWPGAPDDSTVFPARYSIDYVKAFEPVTAGACTGS